MGWIDWLKKFFSEPGTVLVVLSSGVLGLIVGAANGVIQKRHGGWPAFFAATASGTVVAVIVGLGTANYIESETLRLAIVGFCAVISDDILMGFKALGVGIRTDPIGTFWRIVDAIRGKMPSPAPLPPTDLTPTTAPKE